MNRVEKECKNYFSEIFPRGGYTGGTGRETLYKSLPTQSPEEDTRCLMATIN